MNSGITIFKIHLFSNNAAKSFSFFSFLFDTDILTDNNQDNYILIDSTRYYFSEKIKNSVSDKIITLGVDTLEELRDLRNKVMLAFYKINASPSIISSEEGSFTFLDMDENTWSIELM